MRQALTPPQTFRTDARSGIAEGVSLGKRTAPLVGGLLFLPLIQDGFSLSDVGIAFLASTAVFGFFVALFAVVASAGWLLWTVRVDRQGLRGRSAFGWPLYAQWCDITDADVHDGHLVLKRRGKFWDLYIPLNIKRETAFYDLVLSLTSEGHPLYYWVTPARGEEVTSPGASGPA